MFTDAIRNDRAPLGQDFPTLAEGIRNIRAPLNQCIMHLLFRQLRAIRLHAAVFHLHEHPL